MYAMRYGAIPIVRSIGGLKDTVPDIAEPGGIGRGIRFDQATLGDIGHAIHRGAAMWHNEPGIVAALRERIMAVDFSWENTVGKYFSVYQRIGASVVIYKQEAEVTEVAVAVDRPAIEKEQRKVVVSAKPAISKKVAKKAETVEKKPAPKKKGSIK
jgi:hypothetical protein